MISIFFLFYLLLNLPLEARADHPQHPLSELQKWGFQKVETSSASPDLRGRSRPKDLPFPLELKMSTDQFGAVMHQFQNWTTPAYFHGGLDIRAERHQKIYAPVSGTVEAGYYSYKDSFDGRSEKFWLDYREVLEGKLTPPWSELYFEVAVIDEKGFRFELHHIDANSLPFSLVNKIKNGGKVQQGELVGVLVDWPRKLLGYTYHHLHYNVVDPQGVYVNPFSVSKKVLDFLPPQIAGIYGTRVRHCGSQSPRLLSPEKNSTLETEDFLVVEAFDEIQRGRARHVPASLRAEFSEGQSFEWDFRERLRGPQGEPPNITHIYLYSLCDEKDWLQTATKNFVFYLKVPVPPNYQGPIKITVTDFVGHQTQQTVMVKSL